MSGDFPRYFRVGCIQNNAGSDIQKNLSWIKKKIISAAKVKPRLVCLPEVCCWRGSTKKLGDVARQYPMLLNFFQDLASKYKIHILLGSLIETSSQRGRFYNTSLLLSDKGGILAKYQKIHLFDIDLKNVSMHESDHIISGSKIVVQKVKNVFCGMSVCYDLRFPELFRQLTYGGSQLIFIPSNFTWDTGKAHWEILIRARAIENQVFVIAPGQVGRNPETGVLSYGNSLIIDPWGSVLARASASREEFIWADLDLGMQASLRKKMPVLQHRKIITISK